MYDISLPHKTENDMALLRTFMISSYGFCYNILLLSELNAFILVSCWLRVELN